MTRPELTYEEFCARPMTLYMHLSGDKEHYIHRFNQETGVNKVTITLKKKDGSFGKSTDSYYIADDPVTYYTPDQMYVAYMKKVCGIK
jgi:hypothetical protein